MLDQGPDVQVLRINDDLAVPLEEISFRFSRSSGPGGQHVNRSETRVELLFDVGASPSLSDEQRQRLLARLAGQIDTRGVLHLVSATSRSQLANREDVLERFRLLLLGALRRRKKRLPTRPTAAGRERRLEGKRRRSEIKGYRRRAEDDF